MSHALDSQIYTISTNCVSSTKVQRRYCKNAKEGNAKYEVVKIAREGRRESLFDGVWSAKQIEQRKMHTQPAVPTYAKVNFAPDPSAPPTHMTARRPHAKSHAHMPNPLKMGSDRLSSTPPSSKPSATAATIPLPRQSRGKGIAGAFGVTDAAAVWARREAAREAASQAALTRPWWALSARWDGR